MYIGIQLHMCFSQSVCFKLHFDWHQVCIPCIAPSSLVAEHFTVYFKVFLGDPMLVFIPIKFIVFFERFFDLELLFWGNVVINCCLYNRLFGNLPGCSIIIFLASWVVVETQRHAHLLTGQNPCWLCETHYDLDLEMSPWFSFGLHVSHSVAEQTVEMFLVDWISTVIDTPPFI